MKKFFTFFVMLFCCVAMEAQVSASQAYSFVRATIRDRFGNYDYYVGEWNTNSTTLPGPSWLIFVDMEPNNGWEHPCKYVYVSKSSLSSYNIVDSVRPPSGVALEPIYKPNRYDSRRNMKPYVPYIPSNDPNPEAVHTYAVILNGGMSPTANSERYWNDCSFIYKTLKFRYGVPQNNIKVLMSDGTDNGADMADMSGQLVSSPLDLDGDGCNDVTGPANYGYLQGVLNEMAHKMTDEDHLLLFITGHGGRDLNTGRSYIYLWDEMKLYPEELNSYLNPIDSGFVSIVMEPCYSGGFIDALKRPNRVIATACKANERSYGSTTVPFNEFVYHWTSALSGYDAFGNAVDAPKNITMLGAQLYAARKDTYANGGSSLASETPQINYFTNSVVSKLSLANIPPTVYLGFDDYEGQIVSELKTTDYQMIAQNLNNVLFKSNLRDIVASYYDLKDKYHAPSYFFWNNPYIWLRNNNDGIENQETEKLIIEEGKPVYTYFKIRNKGVRDYIGNKDKVRGYWSKSNIAISAPMWQGYVDPEDKDSEHVGGSMSALTLRYAIPAGKTYIGYLQKTFENDDLWAAQQPDFNMCVLIYICDKDSASIVYNKNRIVEVWDSDKLGQSNVTHLFTDLNTNFVRLEVKNVVNKINEYTISAVDNYDLAAPAFSEAKISMKLSSDLLTSWNSGGKVCIDAEEDKNEQGVFLLQSDSCKFCKIGMTPYQSGWIGLKCNFLADNDISERKTYDLNIAIRDDSTGLYIGGETFRIVQEPRLAINPVITTATQNGITRLIANNVSEAATYRWYDSDGILIGEGQTLAVPTGTSLTSYRVVAEAVKDGAIGNSVAGTTAQLEQTQKIVSVDSQSNPNTMKVVLSTPASDGAVLRLASSAGNLPVTTYSVESGTKVCNIPAGNLPSGVYQVTLIENGAVTGAQKFTK